MTAVVAESIPLQIGCFGFVFFFFLSFMLYALGLYTGCDDSTG